MDRFIEIVFPRPIFRLVHNKQKADKASFEKVENDINSFCPTGHRGKMAEKLDGVDRKILNMLQNDALGFLFLE